MVNHIITNIQCHPLNFFQEPIKTGIDLQKYIEEEFENAKKSTSAQKQQELSSRSFENSPSLNEPVYFDVPIKIEENGEGFTPPSEIRYNLEIYSLL